MTDDGTTKAITITMGWQNGGAKWSDGAWVQNFAQWPDPANPGKYFGMTCNAEYKRNDSYSKNVKVENMYGQDSLANADNGSGRKWDEYGLFAPVALFVADEVTPERTYASSYASKKSYQACGAQAVLWQMEDDDDVDEDVNERYWDIKNGPAIRITSGFRVWEKASDGSPKWKADAPEFSYQLFDFGIEEPKPEVIVPKDDDEEETEGSGAAALTAMATAAIAALLFA